MVGVPAHTLQLAGRKARYLWSTHWRFRVSTLSMWLGSKGRMSGTALVSAGTALCNQGQATYQSLDVMKHSSREQSFA